MSIVDPFLSHAHSDPTRSALEVGGESWTYGELLEAATRTSASIPDEVAPGAAAAVLGARTGGAFVGVLAALVSGRTYVPLNPSFPITRLAEMLDRAGAGVLLVDPERTQMAKEVVALSNRDLPIVEVEDRAQGPVPDIPTPAPDADDLAYVLFTSGTTGRPKAVGVTHANVSAFVEHILDNWDFDSDDRFSQTFDFTFDLSVFDMFVCWGAGATLVCPTPKTLLNPVRWIRDAGLTVWFSVPSMITFMSRLGGLTEGRFPALRRSLFCGEALAQSAAEAWAAAAPSSTIDNLYGPTELTIACTAHRWTPGQTITASGTVPIGEPFPAMHALVVDDALRESGDIGELIMTGPQLTPGYLDDPERTAAAFVVPPGRTDVYYRTGDRVRVHDDGMFEYVGRVDHQIKVNGYRVELGEVEAAAREVLGGIGLAAVGHPPTPSGYGGIALVVEDDDVDQEVVRAELQSLLPAYMVPRLVDSQVPLPLNPNGKIDRSAIQSALKDGSR